MARLGAHHCLREAQAHPGVAGVEHPAAGEDQAPGRHRQLLGHRAGDERAGPLGGLERGVADHQGDARRVAAEVHRRQVGVGDAEPDVGEIDPQHLGDHRGEHRIGALANLGLAAEHRDGAGAVELQLHRRLRHVVPVDRQPGAAQVGAAGQPQAAPARQAPVAFAEAAAGHHRLDAGPQAHRADAQPVGGDGAGLGEHAAAQVGGVDAQVAGDLVELDLEAEARLRRAVAPLRPAGGLVGEDPHSFEAVGRQLVGHRLQGAGVVGRGDAVAAVGAAVERRLQVLRGDRAVAPHAGAQPHQHRVAAAVAVEDLLAAERHLHRAAEAQRHLRRHDLVVERVALAAEAAAVRAGDHPDARRRHLEHARQRPVHVVRRLRRRVEGDPVVVLGHRDGGMLLHRQVGVALVEEDVLEDLVGRGEALGHRAEVHRHLLVHVAAVAVVMQPRLGGRQRLLDAGDGGQRLVLDLHLVGGLVGGVLGQRRHRRHRVADEAHLVGAERVLVLGDRQDAEGHREVAPGQEAQHARHPRGRRQVDAGDARVRHRRAHEAQVDHAGKGEVVGIARGAGDLGAPVHPPERLADDVRLALGRWLGAG